MLRPSSGRLSAWPPAAVAISSSPKSGTAASLTLSRAVPDSAAMSAPRSRPPVLTSTRSVAVPDTASGSPIVVAGAAKGMSFALSCASTAASEDCGGSVIASAPERLPSPKTPAPGRSRGGPSAPGTHRRGVARRKLPSPERESLCRRESTKPVGGQRPLSQSARATSAKSPSTWESVQAMKASVR